MAINVSQAFHRTSANPIDESMALTKAQMLTVNDNLMPAYYLTICQDDGAIYLYDKSAEVSEVTGKFRKLEVGDQYVENSDLGDLVIDLYNSSKADYKVDDYVIYQKKLYRCKTANTANLPTNTTDWEKVNIIDTIDKKVNEHVPDLSDYVNNSDLGHLIVAVYTQKTYAVGDFCIYNKKFYQCSTAIDAAEVWTPAHWTEVTIMEVMDAKIGAIDLTPYLTEVDLGNVVATIWNKSTANTVGQYVIHDRKLYRCTSNTTAGADWDSSKWTEVKLTAIFQGSTSQVNGTSGLVPPPEAGIDERFLAPTGLWVPLDIAPEEDIDKMFYEVTIGGRDYPYTRVGNQLWLTEELNLTWSGLSVTTDNTATPSISQAMRVTQAPNYLLYNYLAIDDLINNHSDLLPDGWRVPAKSDYDNLIANNTLGSLKSVTGWTTPGTDTTKMSLRPLIYRWNTGVIDSLTTCHLRTSDSVYYLKVENSSISVINIGTAFNYYCAVRLVKDVT